MKILENNILKRLPYKPIFFLRYVDANVTFIPTPEIDHDIRALSRIPL